LNMNSQLHETTLSLISLIHFYSRLSGGNEKIKCAINLSQVLTIKGMEASSEETKLQFCSDAVEAITSVVIESKVKTTKAGPVVSLLDKEEIDFIQDLMFNDVRHNIE
jgi:hypothetical protein